MKKISLELLGKSLTRNELRDIKGGSGCVCTSSSYYCWSLDRKSRCTGGVGCC